MNINNHSLNHAVEGVGLGLREIHLDDIVNSNHSVKWFELLLDNWLATGGFVSAALNGIADKYPVSLHGVGLSLGSVDPINMEYLKKVKNIINQTDAIWYSEHCSFSSFSGQHVPDLLPLPYTNEALSHLTERIDQVQDYLQQPILIENISSYVMAPNNDYSEAAFLANLVKNTGCYLLLDLNNTYISCCNHNWDINSYLRQLPISHIKEIHLAGYHQEDDLLVDSHSTAPSEAVWSVYNNFLLEYSCDIPTLIEWDNQLPSFDVLVEVQQKAETLQQQAKRLKAVSA